MTTIQDAIVLTLTPKPKLLFHPSILYYMCMPLAA